MAALISGAFRVRVSVNLVARETSLGRTSEAEGTSNRSSKVRASSIVSGNMEGSSHKVQVNRMCRILIVLSYAFSVLSTEKAEDRVENPLKTHFTS